MDTSHDSRASRIQPNAGGRCGRFLFRGRLPWLAVFWLAFGLPAVTPLAWAAQPAVSSPLGQSVEDFRLVDTTGRPWRLDDIAASRLVVVAFLGNECPLAGRYAPRLVALHERYGEQGVAFVALNSNQQDAPAETARFALQHRLTFPLLIDEGNRIADRLGAERTPEVFLLDENRLIRYWGRIDDQYGIGFAHAAPKKQDLADAIEDLLAGRGVAQPVTVAAGCHIGRVRPADAQTQVTYTRDIAPLLARNCVVCHRAGQVGPMPLTSYEEVAGWAEMMREVVESRRMPPWHASGEFGQFANDRCLKVEEIDLVRRWAEAGAPRGDLAQLEPVGEFPDGWGLPRAPDLVLPMSSRPADVPAEGVMDYLYFRVDPHFEEAKWIAASEVAPSNRAVVHHVLVFARPPNRPNAQRLGDGGGEFLAAYVPGLGAMTLPAGMAKLVPAGTIFEFQVHYAPIGTSQQDLSSLGLVFADPASVEFKVATHQAEARNFRIPAGAANHRVESYSKPAPTNLTLLSLMPHMHLRGKSFRYILHRADGTAETLLDVPAYDFNWQTAYYLAKPLQVAPGSRLHCVAHFDNSADNLANPDPTQTVGYGQQSFNEMMIGYFDIATPVSGLGEVAGTRHQGHTGDAIQRASAGRWALLLALGGAGIVWALFVFWKRKRSPPTTNLEEFRDL